MPAPLLPKPPAQPTPQSHSGQTPLNGFGLLAFDGQNLRLLDSSQVPIVATNIRDALLPENVRNRLSQPQLNAFQRRNQLDNRKKSQTTWLDEQWGGRGWLPPVAQFGTGRYPEPSVEMVDSLVKITMLAQGRGVDLHLLWAKGGALRNAIPKESGTRPRPRLSAGRVKAVAQGILDGTISLVADDSGSNQPIPEVINLPDDNDIDDGDDNGNDDDNDNGINNDDDANMDDHDEGAFVPEVLSEENAIHNSDPPSRNDASNINRSNDRAMDTGPTQAAVQMDGTTTKKRRFEQISGGGNAQYEKYKSVVASAHPEEIERLLDKAILDLEQAEAEKEAADFALGYFRGRGDQLKEIHQQSDIILQDATNELDSEQSILPGDNTPSGTQNTSSQGVIAGVLTTTGKVFLHGINKLRDALLQTHPSSENQLAATQHRKQHADAVEKLRAAKARLDALDRIKKARQMEGICNEMRDQRRKLRSLLEESDRRVAAVEMICAESFRTAEEENWATILLPRQRNGTRPT
ncbi:hypothetical protein ACHAPJ_011126 [Fusarium lateritium]